MPAAITNPANIGVGGAGAIHVLDNNQTDIPFSLHFEGGSGDAHVSAATLTKMCGNVVPTQINPVALSFGSTSNMNSEAHFVTAHLGAPGSTVPLHTQGRDFHLSSAPSVSGVEGTVNAAHAVANPGMWNREPVRHTLTDVSAIHGNSHPSAGHTGNVDAATTAKGLRQAMSWSNSVGATMEDVMHGCVTAKSPVAGEPSRVSIPLDTSLESSARGQLAALCHRKQAELVTIVGEHHITEPMANPLISGPHVPHVVVTEDAAKTAAAGLVKNLQGGPLANGMTFCCRDASGNHPPEPVTVACTLHRSPGLVSGVNLADGQSLLASHVSHLFEGEARSTVAEHPPVSTESATDAMTAAMFNTKFKLRPKPVANGAPMPAAPTEVVLHGAETNAAGGYEGNSSGDEA
jgi:hypothetical protein